MKLGSLFSGFGGLDLAVESVFGARTVWVSDIEPGPRKVLAHRFPGVPNLGDITAVDWTRVEPVDIIAGGSPCQDISAAGRMAGMRAGTRSNLWVEMREAIRALQPAYVIWENVYAARSTAAASAMESDPRLLGDHPNGQPVLRALGRVLGDLASLGFDAEWHSLRAADVGAPHGRARYFVVAVTRDPARRAEVAGRLRGWPHRRRGVSTSHEERQEANQLGGQSHHQYDDWRSASVASHAADLWGWPLPTPGADREVSGGVALVAYREGRAQAATYGCAALLDGQAQAGGGDLGIPGASGVRATERAGNGRLGSNDEGHWRCCKGSDHPVECTGCGCDRSDACTGCVAAHPERVARGEWRFATAGQSAGGRPLGADPRRDRAPITLLPTPKTTDDRAHSEGDMRRNDPGLRALPSLLPTPSAGNFNAGEDPEQWEARRQRVKETANNGNGMGVPLGIAVQLLPTPKASNNEKRQSDRYGMNLGQALGVTPSAGHERRGIATHNAWGPYAAAIARWEAIHGPAPAPTKPGRNGRPKLNPEFAEWLMGAPAGWITDTPGVTDTEALRMAGNGVVRQQAVAALRLMLNRMELAA